MDTNLRSRTHSWQDPVEASRKGLQLSGIDYLRAMSNGELPPPPLMSTLDFSIGEIAPGVVTFHMEPKEFHYNPLGSVHGGVITALLDSAMGCSIQSLLPKGTGYTTLELKVNFLRPITTKSGNLTCIGKAIHSGSKIALTEAQITDGRGKIVAHGVSTCMLLQLE
jgi:uncharacterized protein (TIGR00369 family)